jgi:signal transduction histidine kinase
MYDLAVPNEQFTALQQAAQQMAIGAAQIAQQIEQQKALSGIIDRIRASLEIELIFEITATEVRQLLNADRVGIFRFAPGSGCDEGEFVSECVGPEFASALAVKVYDHCFGPQFAPHYINGRVQAVADIHSANLSDCHIQILEQFQVRANLIVPVLKGPDLWGLLCIHQCSEPRHWQPAEIEFIKQIADHFAIALQQAEYLDQIKAQSIALKDTLEALQKSQAQLIQNEKMASLGQLVAGIAHEINNPINFIYGNLVHVDEYVNNLLALASFTQNSNSKSAPTLPSHLEGIDLDFILQDLPKTLTSMKVGADRIRQIVLSLRNFSRLDEAQFKTVNLHEGIDSTLLILSHRLQASTLPGAVEVIKEYGEIPPLACYPSQLNQVFMNLLTNALDAIEATVQSENGDTQGAASYPKIWIQTRLNQQHQIEICIRDNGVGIVKNVNAKIFDHFFTTKPVGKGTGLGLSIAREIIVEKHYGTITANSIAGEGAEFVISLPIGKLTRDQ